MYRDEDPLTPNRVVCGFLGLSGVYSTSFLNIINDRGCNCRCDGRPRARGKFGGVFGGGIGYGFSGDEAMEDSVVLDDVEDKDCEELPDVEREDVDDPDTNDDVEGYRDEGYRDLLDDDRLKIWCGVEGAVGGGVFGTGMVSS